MKTNIITINNNTAKELLIPITETDTTKMSFQNLVKEFGLNEATIEEIKGKYKEVVTCYPNHATVRKIHFIGLGKETAFLKIREAVRSFSFHRKTKLGASLGLVATFLEDTKTLEAIINGLELSTYDIALYKSTKENTAHPLAQTTLKVIVKDTTDTKIQEAIFKGIATGETQKEVMDLINQPAGHLYPQTLADWVLKSKEKYGYEATILDKAEMEKAGLDAVLAVNRGSEFPPKFIIAEYKPQGYQDFPTIGLVGKGVTYDTGGLNIKVSGMHYMKSDMGGAAMVLGAMELTAKLNLPIHLVVIVPATDNCIDAKSISPGNVIGSYSGKTIEVIDTDAEGRLILADGLYYMVKNYSPDVLINAATLTGSSVRTLGSHAAALFSNNQNLANQIYRVAETTGERVWQLPLYDEFQLELKSDIADIANLGNKPTAGASTAAKFLQNFIGDHKNWAHIDIAGMAYGDSEYASHKSGMGYGVNLLVEYFMDLLSNQNQ
jgi:leucyl aminopeptidase